MNDTAHTLYDIVRYTSGFGPTVMLPLVLFILALFFKVKPAKALRSSLTVGIGFVSIYAIFDILTNNAGPAAQAMVKRTGINLSMMDLGWSPFSAITWDSPVAPFVIPLTILINVAMLALNRTRIVGIGIWDYWYLALTGTLVYYGTDSLLSGLLTAAIAMVVIPKLAGWSAPLVQKYFDLEGTSLLALPLVVLFPVGLLIDKIIDHIPGLSRIHIDLGAIQKKSGILGGPMMVSTILGILLGIIAGYDFKKVLLLGVNTGGMTSILPRIVRILMEGLLPLSEAIRRYLNAEYPDCDGLYIGLNIAVAVGNPATISTALLLTPISVSIAFILPGNGVLSFGDLANLAVMALMAALANRGNIFRTVLAAIPVTTANLWIVIKIAPFTTSMTKGVNLKLAEGSSDQVSGFLDDDNPLRFQPLEIFNGNIIATGLVPVIALVLYSISRMTWSTVYA